MGDWDRGRMVAQGYWKCHVCSTIYPFAVTNRCLEDGHHFCFNRRKEGRRCQDYFTQSEQPEVSTSNQRDSWKFCQYPKQCKDQADGDEWDYLDVLQSDEDEDDADDDVDL